ncbi:MAG TPA: GNAT family N-acetyltransferase [Devosia sp.]|nr:GNAT family N-acetyltransferase [Devosia sp.]
MALDAEPLDFSQSDSEREETVRGAPAHALTRKIVSGEFWDHTISGFDGVAQEQLHVFAKSRWPSVICEPNLFMDNGEVVGGALVMVQPLPLGLGAIAVVKWGPMLKDNQRADAKEIYVRMIEMLIEEYSDNRAMMLSVLPKATPSPHNMALEHLKLRGFAAGSKLLFPNRYIVNLRLSDEDQRKSFAQKWRYHLNKSQKQNLEFEHVQSAEISKFFALYEAMSDRKKFADHSAFDTINDLMAVSQDALRPEMFFVRHEGEIVAGAIIFKAGDTAVYLYGATNDRALPLRAGYFLHWHIIRWLRDNTDAKWYDLGGTDGFQGLHQFKKGMVGSAGAIEPVPPVMNYASHMKARVFASLAYWARDRMQDVRRWLEKMRSDLATPDQGG